MLILITCTNRSNVDDAFKFKHKYVIMYSYLGICIQFESFIGNIMNFHQLLKQKCLFKIASQGFKWCFRMLSSVGEYTVGKFLTFW